MALSTSVLRLAFNGLKAVVKTSAKAKADHAVGAPGTRHVTPNGLECRAAPDGHAPISHRAAGGLEVEVIQRHGEWAQVEFDNGWRGWVDGRTIFKRT